MKIILLSFLLKKIPNRKDRYKELKLLDDILRAIKNTTENKMEEMLLRRKVYDNTPRIKVPIQDKSQFAQAIEYLEKIRLIDNNGFLLVEDGGDIMATEFIINYNGIVKISMGGFVHEAKKEYRLYYMNAVYWIISMVVATAAFVFSVVKG
ncbi:MAG TPA: hypothetical protein VK590_04915 [Saprospiraceae bacterium]|nr:hypothetical protein [Saprospiraceae bacterium]